MRVCRFSDKVAPVTATMDALLTTEQFARRVRKSVSQVNRLASAGVITPAIQAPGPRGARLWTTAEALAYLNGDHDENTPT